MRHREFTAIIVQRKVDQMCQLKAPSKSAFRDEQSTPLMASIAAFVAIMFSVCSSLDASEIDPAEFEKPVLAVDAVPLADVKEIFKEWKLELPSSFGVCLQFVSSHGPTGKAGVAPYDIVTHINKKPIKTMDDFKSALEPMKIGKPVELTGYSTVDGKNGKQIWKKGTVKVIPISRKEWMFNCFDVEENASSGVKTWKYKGNPKDTQVGTEAMVNIVKRKESPLKLRLRIQHVDSESLLNGGFMFRKGFDPLAFTPSPDEIKRDRVADNVRETFETDLDDKQVEFFRNHIRAEGPISMQFDGQKSEHEYGLLRPERIRISQTLLFYDLLRSELP